MKLAVGVLVVVIMFARVAAAQPAAVPTKLPSVPVAQPASEDRVSERMAFWLSFGGAVASWATIGAGFAKESGRVLGAGMLGMMFTPTIGHWYARRAGTRGLGLRVAGTVAVVVAFGFLVACEGSCADESSAALGLLLFGGAGMTIAGTIDDVATAPRAARSYNARRERVIVPIVNPDTRSLGLAFAGRF